MSNIEFKIEGLDEFQRGIAQSPKNMEKRMTRGMYDSVKRVERTAREKAPRGVSSPGLKNSILGKVLFWHTGEVGVLNRIRHARAVEEGSRPHPVPPSALYKWARIKLGAKDYKGVAVAVARKIARVGTKAQPYLRPAIEENERWIVKRFTDAIDDILMDIASTR